VDVYHNSETRMIMAQKCRAALDVVSKDLRNIYSVEQDDSLIFVSQDNPDDAGDRDVVSFVTLVHTDPDPFLAQLNQGLETGQGEESLPISDVQRVAYYVGPDLTQSETLQASQSTDLTVREEVENLVLSRISTTSIDPQTVIASLFDSGTVPSEDENGNPIQVKIAQIIDRVASFDLKYSDGEDWYESWEETNAIPKAVQILIAVRSEEYDQSRQNLERNTMTQSTMIYLPMSANFGGQPPGGQTGEGSSG
ncbi:MAG: hypothetical protein OXI86_13335, partial [Candidatus Poribacteria bacterium]|nr:hypothetical protein [Candidatus Poribacteria bacterium]